MRGFKRFCGLPSIHGAIDETQIHIQKPHSAFVGTIFLSNQKFTRCNYKLWLIVKRNFWIFLLDYLVPWMMFKFYAFLTCMERRWMETCFISIEVKRESNIIWLLTRATFYYHGWWFHTNKLKAFNILSLKHYIINIYGEAKMLWKIHLAFWKKTSKNYF